MKKAKRSFMQRVRLWVRSFFKLSRVYRQTLYGIWKITGVPLPRVTIFGSARLKQNDFYAKQAYELGGKFIENGISVLTGGGPGIMEAVSCGALQKNNGELEAISMGIGVKELGEGKNPCVQEYIELDYFFARKYLLTRSSIAFIVFPGGFGTIDEMGEVLTLIQTKIMPKMPIVLIGTEYWDLFLQWLREQVLKHGAISEADLKLFTVTDDIDYAFKIVSDFCKKQEKLH